MTAYCPRAQPWRSALRGQSSRRSGRSDTALSSSSGNRLPASARRRAAEHSSSSYGWKKRGPGYRDRARAAATTKLPRKRDRKRAGEGKRGTEVVDGGGGGSIKK